MVIRGRMGQVVGTMPGRDLFFERLCRFVRGSRCRGRMCSIWTLLLNSRATSQYPAYQIAEVNTWSSTSFESGSASSSFTKFYHQYPQHEYQHTANWGRGGYIILTPLLIQIPVPLLFTRRQVPQKQFPRPRSKTVLIGDTWRVNSRRYKTRLCVLTSQRETCQAVQIDRLFVSRVHNPPEVRESSATLADTEEGGMPLFVVHSTTATTALVDGLRIVSIAAFKVGLPLEIGQSD